MKKVKRRTYMILILPILILTLSIVFLFRLASDGEDWVLFPSNLNVFSQGQLNIGSIYDRNGIALAVPGERGLELHANTEMRRANFHAVGDRNGSIGTGAIHAYGRQLIGYNLITGVYSRGGQGNTLHLTIDAAINRVAFEALGGRSGSILVMNYETGEVLVNVSGPSYDPLNPPQNAGEMEGIYLNRGLSSRFTPGSIFKIVTAAAALEQFPDALSRTFTCTGSLMVDGNLVTCTGTHGTINLTQAMGHSCNPFFAQLALDLGGNTLRNYTEQFGLLSTHRVGNTTTAAGHFTAGAAGSPALAWSGVGQSENLINPLSMVRFLGAIARGGVPIEPYFVSEVTGGFLPYRARQTGERIMPTTTAHQLQRVLLDIVPIYYPNAFPGLNLAGKTGTAEVDGQRSHAWFAGFLDDPNHPYAFVVFVENGGGGLAVAGSIANTVLQAMTR